MSANDPNVWNLVIDNDAGGENLRGVGLAISCLFDVVCEIRDELRAISEKLGGHLEAES